MKKTYIAPMTIAYNVSVANMMALSLVKGVQITSDNKDEFQQLTNEEKTSINVWDQEW